MPALALQVVVSRRKGEGRHQSAGWALDTALSCTFVLTFAVVAALFSLKNSLLLFLSADKSVVSVADPYFTFILLVMFPGTINFTMRSFYSGLGHTSFAMREYMLMLFIHIPLSILLVYGLGPFPRLGLTGAAVSNLFCSCAATAYLVAAGYKFRKKYRFLRLRRLDPTMMRAVFRIGLPDSIMYTAAYLNEILYIKVLSLVGISAIAASRAVIIVDGIVVTLFIAISEGAEIFMGQRFGAGECERAILMRRAGTQVNIIFAFIFAIPVLLFPQTLLRTFVGDPIVAEIGAQPLRILAGTYFLVAFAVMDASVIRAGGDNKVLMYFSLTADYFGFLPAAYCFGVLLGGGLTGAVLAFPAYWFIRMMFSRWWVGGGHWRVREA